MHIAPKSEIQLAREYIRIAKRHGLRPTLFLTGKTLAEEWDECRWLADEDGIEVGGHTYSAFQPLWAHRAAKVIGGSYWMGRRQQHIDMKRTVEIFAEKLYPLCSWRTHSYEYNIDTADLLRSFDIGVWSDIQDKSIYRPVRVNDRVISLAINVREDHSGFFHGFITKERVEPQGLGALLSRLVRRGQRAVTQVTDGATWATGFREDVKVATSQGVAVMNLHPVCMYLLDGFQTFDKLCAFLASYESLTVSEACDRFSA